MRNYKNIFEKTEIALKKQCSLSEKDFEKQFGRFKKFESRTRSDDEVFEMLILIIFYSGFKSATVEKKEPLILSYFPDYKSVSEYDENNINKMLSDVKMIKNEQKIKACINNAKVLKKIINKHNSFQEYLDSFDANNSFENLILLKEDLEYHFNYLGKITVYHFLTDLGFNVLKPDRVMMRIFNRLGFIDNENQLLKTVIQGRLFAKETKLPIRYIDIIFVKYGQLGESKDFGLKNGICLEKNPKCELCGLIDECNYYKRKP